MLTNGLCYPVKVDDADYNDSESILCTCVRNPGRDISFPIFTKKEVETKKFGKEIKTIISRLNDLSSFLSNIE